MKIFFFFLILLVGTASRASCGLSMTVNNLTINWDLNFTTVAVQIVVDKSSATACDFGIGITKGSAGSYGARSVTSSGKNLRYQIYKETGLTNVIKDVPDITTANDVIQGGFGTGTNLTQTVLYYFEIPYSLATTPSLAAQGTYTDSYTVNLYEGSTPTAFSTPEQSTGVTLTINVPYIIALSLVDPGGSFSSGSTSRSLSFGTLAEGSAQTVDVRVRTNAGFNVTFSSANNGRLRHTNPAKNSYVPYKFYSNSVLLDMSNSLAVPVSGLTASGQTSLNGLGYPLKFVIGSLSSSTIMGGPHSDSITITATTTE